MSADALLSRLQHVRNTGHGRWVACCPSHDDRSPSLSITELDDGRTLIRCFAGCASIEVLSAVNLDFTSLFPERGLAHRLQRPARPFNALDILACIAFEASVASVAADNLASGIALSQEDRDRLRLAATRLDRAAELANGDR